MLCWDKGVAIEDSREAFDPACVSYGAAAVQHISLRAGERQSCAHQCTCFRRLIHSTWAIPGDELMLGELRERMPELDRRIVVKVRSKDLFLPSEVAYAGARSRLGVLRFPRTSPTLSTLVPANQEPWRVNFRQLCTTLRGLP